MSRQEQYDESRGRVVGQRIKLTEEDKVLLRECRSESFFYRCIPLSLVLLGGVRYLQAVGVIKGKYLGVSIALLTGYGAGKISYIPACRKKFLEKSPDSDFSKVLTGQANAKEILESQRQSDVLPHSQQYQSQEYNRSQITELDDYKRPSLDREVPFTNNYGAEEETRKAVTYDELRQKHRQQFEPSRSPSKLQPLDDRLNNRPTDSYSSPDPPSRLRPHSDHGKKNQYGDVWESGN